MINTQDDSTTVGPILQSFCNQATIPRLIWATATGDKNAVHTALKEGDDINCRVANGRTSLHCAITFGQISILKLLLESGADINAVDKEFRTPLHFAADAGESITAAKMLLGLGANVDALDNTMLTPLHLAMRVQGCSSVGMITLLLDNCADVNTYDQHGRTPLHKAANGGRYDVAAMFLERGADVNALDHSKNTPLHEAVKGFDGGHSVEMIKLLLKWGAGAVVGAADENGTTALHWAALGESEEVVELLLENGADINAIDDMGRTPLDRAIWSLVGVSEPVPDGIRKLLEKNGGLRANDIAKDVNSGSTGKKSHKGAKQSVVGVTREGVTLRSNKSNIQVSTSKTDDSYSRMANTLPAEGSLRVLLGK